MMEYDWIEDVSQKFSFLITKYNFDKRIMDESMKIEFYNDRLNFKFQKYRVEIYLTIQPINQKNNSIAMYNLLEYIHQNQMNPTKINFFSSEINYQVSLMKQVDYMAKVLIQNYSLIQEFYNPEQLENNLLAFDRYWKYKHPEYYVQR